MKASSLYTSLGHGMISCVIDKMDVQRLTIFSVADNCPYVRLKYLMLSVSIYYFLAYKTKSLYCTSPLCMALSCR